MRQCRQGLTSSLAKGIARRFAAPAERLTEQAQGLLASFQSDVESGILKAEPNQEKCCWHLDDLFKKLPAYTNDIHIYNAKSRQYNKQRGELLKKLVQEDLEAAAQLQSRKQKWGALYKLWEFWDASADRPHVARQKAAALRESRVTAELGEGPQPPHSPQGLYIYGSVGSGKTMLMDRFYAAVEHSKCVPVHRRMHFNLALMEVHSRMHFHEKDMKRVTGNEDQVEAQRQAKQAKMAVRRFVRQRMRLTEPEVAEKLAHSNAAVFSKVAASLIGRGPGGLAAASGSPAGGEALEGVAAGRDTEASGDEMQAGVLCFDEVNINDPFTAIALKGIFEALMDSGVVVVATSNRAPWDLNNYGVHEIIFNHFKRRLLEACTPVQLDTEDFRMASASGNALGPGYLFPLSEATARVFEERWQQCVGEEDCGQPTPTTIPVLFGRTLNVSAAAGGVARFTFSELCDQNRGAADYVAIAQHFHTVFLSGVPIMSLQNRNLARRFIVLLDELYNASTHFHCTAASTPDLLFAGTPDDDRPVFDVQELEQLQFESAAEDSRLRRDVMSGGGVAPVFSPGTATVTSTHLGGLEEKFAFARALSRLHEMSRMTSLDTTSLRASK